MQRHPDHPALHSFPTRRSSDLPGARRAEGPADPDGPAQRQRRVDRARTSDWLHRHEDRGHAALRDDERSEEHTSELQSPCKLVCRLLLEKKKRMMKLFMIRVGC